MHKTRDGVEGNETFHCTHTAGLLRYNWLWVVQSGNKDHIYMYGFWCQSVHTMDSIRGLRLHNLRTKTFRSHPQQFLFLSRGKQLLYFF